MIEFLLVAGVLFGLFFSMIEFGVMLNTDLMIRAAARDGARRAAVDGGESGEVLDRIEADLELAGLDPARAVIEIRPRTAAYGSTIRVRVRYDYEWITPVMRQIAGEVWPLQAELVTRSERLGRYR